MNQFFILHYVMWQGTGDTLFRAWQRLRCAVPSFLLFEAKLQHARCLVGVRKVGLPL